MVNIPGTDDYVMSNLESEFHLESDTDSYKSEYDEGFCNDTSSSSLDEQNIDLLKDI